MTIVLQGHALNQRQLDAVTPVMNDYMQGRIRGQKKLEEAMVKALEAAGCSLGYDTSMPGGDKTIEQRATAWLRDGQVGMSSRAIHDHMLGLKAKEGYSYPYDPADLNRCLLLLELIPEWKARMPEMADHNKGWAQLMQVWEQIVDTFLEEVGLDWSKGRNMRASKTYHLMQTALERR